MKPILLIGVLWLALAAHAEPRIIATINDPVGDDNGSGSLIFPQRSDFQPGDLDLVQLQISRDDEGYWFEATFKNPIRDPAIASSADGRESLSYFARKGFYQFNLDIYVDTDRVKGSGNTFTLPGRKVSIDPAFAWERVVILTPRPEAMRSQLLDVMERQFPDRPKVETAANIDQAMLFPTRVRVRNKSVIFLVPVRFIGESDAKDWAVTAFVTGAKTDIALSLPLLPSSKTPLEELDLGVMQPAIGQPRDTFGYVGGVAPSPVVDLLLPAPSQQAQLLSIAAALPGVVLGATDSTARREAPSPQPKPVVPMAAVPALKDLLQPGTRTEPAAAGEATATTRPSIAKRLETLQQLLDQKLITEAEFKEQRQRILNDL